MQRNSSFFWASDDLREQGGDDDCSGDYGGVENGEGSSRRIQIGWTDSIEEEEDDHDELREESNQSIDASATSLSERIALNRSYDGYGSANVENGRRRLFEMPTAKTSARKEHYYAPVKGIDTTNLKSIRFQVVIWHIGTIDVQTGFVKVRFRLTLFWTDDEKKDVSSSPSRANKNIQPDTVWVMEGRQRAHLKKWDKQESMVKDMIDVPPVSILNAVEFETVDAPEITMTNTQSRSMRWTCMYSATLFQGDHMSVKDFPHDQHQIKLKIGILAHRGRGGRWDHATYKLALATEHDSQGSTRIPHGLVVDHCHIHDYGFDPSDLRFQFFPLNFGGWKKSDSHKEEDRDVFLQVTLPVYRLSGHYDTSIFPMLVMLNIIAISCLTRNFNSATAATEIIMGIAFVQVGIRLTLDNRLPCVGYQIKIQHVMNCCFWLLCGLVLESNTVFFLVKKRGWYIEDTDQIDIVAACVAFVYNLYIMVIYFHGRRPPK